MENGLIPEIINGFNMYKGVEDGGERFFGVSGEITLPSLDAITETISGAGILGELEVGNPGHFSPIDVEIPFVAMCDDMLQFSDVKMNMITLRMSHQSTVNKTKDKKYTGLKVIFGGLKKSLKLGTVQIGKQMGSSVVLATSYIKIAKGSDDILLELSKYDSIYTVNNKDMLAEIRKHL